MNKKVILCPCCGCHLIIYFTNDGIAVNETVPDLSQSDVQKVASKLGVEVGVVAKGGD